MVRPESGVPAGGRERAHVMEAAGGASASLGEELGVNTGLELGLGANGAVRPGVKSLQ
jgi:hypothetical protein